MRLVRALVVLGLVLGIASATPAAAKKPGGNVFNLKFRSAEFRVTETVTETYPDGSGFSGTATMVFTADPSLNRGNVGILRIKRGKGGSLLINGTATITETGNTSGLIFPCSVTTTQTLPGAGVGITLEVRARSVRELWLIPNVLTGNCPKLGSPQWSPFQAIGSDPHRVFRKEKTVVMTTDGTRVEQQAQGGDTYTRTVEWAGKVTVRSSG
jgi:hypothetical protein